jgi:hypothetical protein
VVFVEIAEQIPYCTALTGGIANEDDRRRARKAVRDALVKLVSLGDALSLVVRFLAVLQVAMKAVWICWFEARSLLETGLSLV